MALTKTLKIVISLGIIAAVTAVVVPATVIPLMNNNKIQFTLLDNAGVMIESKGIRIYVDPINIGSEYYDLDADVILITHPHGDHYEVSSMNYLQKEGTINVFPENMSDAIILHDGHAVNPGDQLQVGHITITAYYMYTFPILTFPASHPIEANWTSYIIDVDGYTFFHAGDSKNIPEYSALTGTINVALLPLGPGCQTMCDMEVVDVLDVIQPDYLVPIHYGTGVPETFITNYGYLCDCEILHLEYFSSHSFKK
ncbi:MAG: MBL fold metallo-hydrolase [Asgard group archaeon]|nr:MBL fold metallo-hydrolase [Asgard group archaeon]